MTWRKGMAVRQILFCLTVMSFLCRSVIPMGYMPDLSGGRGDKHAITFCTAGSGASTSSLDLTGRPEQSSSDEHAGSQDCPFGLAVSQAVMPGQPASMLLGMISQRPAALLHHNQTLPPLPALGPPLGSRAPPSNLG
ncbi:hypothetical protein SAMN04488135_11647 [Pollutimonas bauzanensis]|uniref:DUF2946 domain-containing protein n=2 Tax=Pollutimonas bauzanensis TaxID=658167 RepID=A0A1M5ZMV8_9BURK|nr:hypothetical protein SAMN04488135_11647 [Pollutimonas bauzanensis]